MSVLVGSQGAFLHIPKSGGSWVRRAMTRAGVDCGSYGERHDREVPAGRRAFCAVRHPLDYLRSRWMLQGWADEFFGVAWEISFADYVDGFLSLPDGHLLRYFQRWSDQCDIVCRLESIEDDLVHALESLGVSFDMERLRGTSRQNVASGRRPHYDEDRARKVCLAERELMEIYGYDVRWIEAEG